MTAPLPGLPSTVPPTVPPPVPPPDLTAALRALDGLTERPVHEHVERFDALHRALQDALATLDEA